MNFVRMWRKSTSAPARPEAPHAPIAADPPSAAPKSDDKDAKHARAWCDADDGVSLTSLSLHSSNDHTSRSVSRLPSDDNDSGFGASLRRTSTPCSIDDVSALTLSDGGVPLGTIEMDPTKVHATVAKIVDSAAPEALVGEMRGIVGHLLFMCVRHADHTGDRRLMSALVTATLREVRRKMTAIERIGVDAQQSVEYGYCLELHAFWLTNTCELLGDAYKYAETGYESTFTPPRAPEANASADGELSIVEMRAALAHMCARTFRPSLAGIVARVFRSTVAVVSKKVSAEIAPLVREFTQGDVATQPARSVASTIQGTVADAVLVLESNGVHGTLVRQLAERVIAVAGQLVHDAIDRKLDSIASNATAAQPERTAASELSGVKDLDARSRQALNALVDQLAEAEDWFSFCFGESPVRFARVPSKARQDDGSDDGEFDVVVPETPFDAPVTIHFSPGSVDFAAIEIPKALRLEGLARKR